MKKIIIIIWLVWVILSAGILIFSIGYEVDMYYGIVNFDLEITQVTIVKNETGQITKMQVSASVTNPSSLTSFEVLAIKPTVFLNEQNPEYIRGQKWIFAHIHPGKSVNISWQYTVEEADRELFNEAEQNNNTWNWFFYMEILLRFDSDLVDDYSFVRTQFFLDQTEIITVDS